MPTKVTYDHGSNRYIIKYRKKSSSIWITLQYDVDFEEWCKLSDDIASAIRKSDLVTDSHLVQSVKSSNLFNRSLTTLIGHLIEQGEKLRKKLKPVITVDYEAKTISYTDFYRNSDQRGRYFNEMREEIKHIESECRRIEDIVKDLFDATLTIEGTNATFDDAERVLAKFDAELHHQVEKEVGMVDALVAENERIVSRLKRVLKDDGTIDDTVTGGWPIKEFVSANTDMADSINVKIDRLLERIENWELSHEPLDTNMGI